MRDIRLKIKKTPSPNFDERKVPISILMLHYTGMESGTAALERLCDPDAKVSAHYVVEEDGRVFQLVDEDKRAWHAGISEWHGQTDINSASIGIEIVNGGHDFGLPDFPTVQIDAVMDLSKAIMLRHNLSSVDVVGHSDVAPGRKQDPGEKFPWERFAKAGIGLWPEAISDDQRVLFEAGDSDRGVSVIQSGLAYIGYKAVVSGRLDDNTQDTLMALQRRYRPRKIDGIVDVQTMEIIGSLAQARRSLMS